MACGMSECVVWYDYQSQKWVVATDCPPGCSCPVSILEKEKRIAPVYLTPNVSPGMLLTCVMGKLGERKVAMFLPYTFSNPGEDEILIRKNGAGIIAWTNEWMHDKLDNRNGYVGCELQRTSRVSTDRSKKPIGGFNASGFVSSTRLQHGLEKEINAFIYCGNIDRQNPRHPTFSNCRTAGVGTFAEFESDLPEKVRRDPENIRLIIESAFEPLFVVKQTDDLNWECVENDDKANINSELIGSIVEKFSIFE